MPATPLAPGLVPGETWDIAEEQLCSRCFDPAWKHAENDGTCHSVDLATRTRCSCKRFIPLA